MQSRYDTQRSPYKKKTRGRESYASLTAFRLLACLVLLGFTLLMRLFLPGATSTIQHVVLPRLQAQGDYRAAILIMGESFSGERDFSAFVEGLHILAFGEQLQEGVYVSAYPDYAYPEMPSIEMEHPILPPIEEVFPVPQLPEDLGQIGEGDSGEEIRGTPASVAVFLSQQEEFYAHSLPERVSLSYEALPIAFQSPLLGPISSPFGFRNHPIQREVRFHFGTDIAVYTGTSFYAFADGYVVYANEDEGWGKYILLYHGAGIYTRYAHAHTVYATQGQRVLKGEMIGRVGQTGAATGPHLHFELMVDGQFRNPEFYVSFE